MFSMDRLVNDTLRPMSDDDTNMTTHDHSNNEFDDGVVNMARMSSSDSTNRGPAGTAQPVLPPPPHLSRSSSASLGQPHSTAASAASMRYGAGAPHEDSHGRDDNRNDSKNLQHNSRSRSRSSSSMQNKQALHGSLRPSRRSGNSSSSSSGDRHSSGESSEADEHDTALSQPRSSASQRHHSPSSEHHHPPHEKVPHSASRPSHLTRAATLSSAAAAAYHSEASVHGDDEVTEEDGEPAHAHEDLSRLSRAALEERVRLSEEWNQRLHRQIESMLHLPRTDLSAMRERMQRAEIALPLLQCYDAALAERDEVIAELRDTLRGYSGEHAHMSTAVCAAEQLAQHIQHRACGELSKAAATQQIREQELSALRAELTRALDAAHSARVERDTHAKQAARAQRELERVRAACIQRPNSGREFREGGVAAAAAPLHTHSAPTTAAAAASQDRSSSPWLHAQQQQQQHMQEQSDHIQLQVLRRVHKDTTQELEQLRDKMIHALKQSSDNHAAHLRVVEERHRTVVEELRAVCRTHELEMVKLRAQLARVECGGGGVLGIRASSAAAAGSASPALTRTTAELVEMQARQAQEMELTRVQAQLLALQGEHDGAVRRWEQKVRAVRVECEQELHDLREAVQRTQSQLDRQKEASALLERRCEKERAEAAALGQRLRESQQSSRSLRVACDAAEATVRDLTEKLQQAEQTLAQTQSSSRQRLHEERERMAALEQRVQATMQHMQGSVTRATEAMNRAHEAREEAVSAQRELERKLERALARVEEGAHELERKEVQLSRLGETVEQQRRQIRELGERAAGREQQVTEQQQQLRKHVLTLESLKLENARLMRSQERRTGGRARAARSE